MIVTAAGMATVTVEAVIVGTGEVPVTIVETMIALVTAVMDQARAETRAVDRVAAHRSPRHE